jgi:hypothetical protein
MFRLILVVLVLITKEVSSKSIIRNVKFLLLFQGRRDPAQYFSFEHPFLLIHTRFLRHGFVSFMTHRAMVEERNRKIMNSPTANLIGWPITSFRLHFCSNFWNAS